MLISYDPEKNNQNILARNLSFDLVEEVEWSTAFILEDLRRDYGERRYTAQGLIYGRLHTIVFTPRDDVMHVISLRKANLREIRKYEQATIN